MGPKWFSDRAQYSDRQEEKGPDNNNCPEQEYAKGGSVSTESPQTKRARFLRSEIRRHRDRRDNRQIAAEEHHETGSNIPWDGLRIGVRIASQTIDRLQSIKGRAVIRGGGRESCTAFVKNRARRDC